MRDAHFVTGLTISREGESWKPPLPSSARLAAETTQTSGLHA